MRDGGQVPRKGQGLGSRDRGRQNRKREREAERQKVLPVLREELPRVSGGWRCPWLDQGWPHREDTRGGG